MIIELLPGDLVLSRKPSFASGLIAWYTGSPWSHVDMIVNPNERGEDLVGAVWPHVRATKFENFPLYSIWRHEGLSDRDRKDLSDWAWARVGHSYDLAQFFLLGWRILTDTLKSVGDDPNPDQYVCSEFVAEAYATKGIKLAHFVDNVLPRHIVNAPSFVKVAENSKETFSVRSI